MFKTMDTNGDGVWNMTEAKNFMRQYAKLLHRNLTGNWTEVLQKGYDEVNTGVSAHELELALSRSGSDIRSFKQFIMGNSKPLPKGHIDPFELMAEMY